jgi:hypothetical protein
MSDGDLLTFLSQGHDDGRSHLLLATRRTYVLTPGRRCEVAPMQEPLMPVIDYYDDRRGQGGALLPRTDPDLFAPLKPAADIVVQGHAYAPSGPVAQLDVSVSVAPADAPRAGSARVLRVFGDRRVVWRGEGLAPSFTDPEPFVVMPLTYDRAYGGRDVWSEAAHPDEVMAWLRPYAGDVPAEELSRYNYARNPAGRGYVVHPSRRAFDEVLLPNLELPHDLLTPERLCSGDPDRWAAQPVPAGFDWCEQSWFPRFAFAGMGVAFDGPLSEFVEVRTGYLTAAQVAHDPLASDDAATAAFDDRIYNGASPWLIVPSLRGDERFTLTHLHRTVPRLEFQLSGERPQVIVDVPGLGPTELDASLKTVIVEPDHARVSAVWGARLPLALPLTEAQESSLRYAIRWRDA